MTKQNLVNLLKKLRDETFEFDEISTNLSDGGLNLSLKSGRGFEGYESLSAVSENSFYVVEYFGMISTAINTFLPEDYSKQISKSIILTNFKKEIESRKRDNIPNYQEFLILKNYNNNYDEVKKSFILNSKIFKDKIRKIKQH